MKKTRVISSVLAFSVILISLFAVSCDNFMSDNDDFEKKLKEDVKVANAAKVEVRVQADPGTGTVQPVGDTVVKVDVPFSLFFIPDNSYGFVRWSVYDLADPNTPLVGVVEFPNGGELKLDTSAILKVARLNVGIKPICEKKPGIEDVYPKENEKGIVRNYPIKILFTKDMDMLASFAYSGASADAAVTSSNPADIYTARTFKNITIDGNSGDPEDPGWKDLSAYFKDPVITNNRLISIVPNVVINDSGAIVSGKALPMLSTVRVTVSTAVVDTLGFPMEDDYSFKFILGEEFDQKPPNISLVDAGLSSTLDFSSDTEAQIKAHRVSAGNLWLGVDVSDAATGGGNVSSLHVYWSLLYGTDGTLVAGPSSAAYDVRSSENTGSNTSWLFEYIHLASLPDGVYQLAITATDTNSQTTTMANATKYLVAKDTTAPDVGNVSKVYFDTGWYNASENSITFSPSSAITDSGVSVAGSVPSIQSPNIEWRFMVGNGGWNAWTSASASATVAIPSTVVDSNAVPITVQFRDDFANTTTDLACPTIPRDTTAPVVTGVDIAGTKYEGKTMVGSGTLNVTITGSDNLSQVAQYSLNNTNTPGTFIPYNPSTTNTGTITIGAADNDYPVYAWVRDAAGNISPVQTAVATVDTTAPTIEKFFLKTTAFAATTDLALGTEGSSNSYPNAQVCYFGFTATDAGVGVSEFSYQDEGAAYSKWFDCSTTAVTSDSDGTYSVNYVKRTNLGGGQVLVTGTLTISGANKLRNVNLKVRDKVGREQTKTGTGNRVIFDNRPPVISSAQIDPTYGVPGHQYPDGTNLYVKDAAQRLNVTAQDQAGDPELSGIKDLVISGALTAPTTSTLSGTVEYAPAVSPNYDITLTAVDGLKVINLIASDYAGNTSGASVNVILDGTAPVIGSLLAMNGTTTISSMGDTGRYSRFQNFFVHMSASDVHSQVKTGAAHTVTVVNNVGTTVAGPLSFANDGDSGTLNLPTASGTYIARVTCYDNVTNSQTGEVSFFFDNQPPVYTSLTVYNGTDVSSPAYVSPSPAKIYIREPQFNIRAFVTDKPAADTGGSGLASIQTEMTGNRNGVVSSWTTSVVTTVENPAALAADRWVFIRQMDGSDSWNIPDLRYMHFTTQFNDKAGNSFWTNNNSSPNILVVVDGVGPNVTISGSITGFTDTTFDPDRFFVQSPTYGYTVEDPELVPNTYASSGVKDWGLSTTTTEASVATWYPYAAPGSDTARLTALLDDHPGAVAYFIARDNAGNVGWNQIGDGAIYLDNDIPMASALTLGRKDGITGTGYTTTGTVDISGTLTEEGSGLGTMSFGGAGLSSIPAGSLTITGWTGNYTVTSPVITLAPVSGNVVPRPNGTGYTITGVALNTTADGEKTINLTVVDKVSQSSTVVSGSITYDHTPPVISVLDSVGHDQGYGLLYYTNSAKATGFRFSANDVTSHVSDYLISTSNSVALDAITHDLADNVATNVDVTGTIATGNPLYLYVRDNAGKIATEKLTDDQPVYLDAAAPSGITVDLDGVGGQESYSTALDTNEINITFTEEVSGLATIAITGVADHTPGGPIVKKSYIGDTLTLNVNDYPRSGTIALTGVVLLDGDGPRTVTATLTDVVGNPSGTVTSDIVRVDTLDPVVDDVWLMRTDGITDPNTTENTYTTTTTVELHLTFTEEGTGIRYLGIGGDHFLSLSGSAVIKKGTDTLVEGTDYTITGNMITFSETNRMTGTTQELSIRGINVSTVDGYKEVAVVSMTDWAGKTATLVPANCEDTILYDATPPTTPTGVSFTTIYTGTDALHYVGPTTTLAMTASDATSSISSYNLVYSTTTTAPAHGTMVSFGGSLTDHDISSLFSTGEARYVFAYLGDKAGNISPTAHLLYSESVTKDDTIPGAPTVTLTAAVTNPPSIHQDGSTYYTKAAPIAFKPVAGTVGSSGPKYFRDFLSPATTDTPYAAGMTVNLAAGAHDLSIVSSVGLVTASPLELTVAVDSNAPSAPTVASSGTGTFYRAGTYYFLSTQGYAIVTLTAGDTGTTQSGLRGYSTSSLGSDPVSGDSLHVATTTIFYAVDNVGRVSAPLTVTVASDGQGPQNFTLGTMPDGAYYPGTGTDYYIASETSRTYTPTADDAGSGMPDNAFYRNSDAAASTISITSAGEKTIHAVDNLGIVSDIVINIHLDNTPPGTPGVTYPGDVHHESGQTTYYTTGDSIVFTPSATHGVSGLKGYSAVGTSTVFYNYSPTLTISLDAGTTTALYAVSNVGPVTGTPLTIEVIKDDAAPSVSTVSSVGTDTFYKNPAYYYKSPGAAIINLSFNDGTGSSGLMGYSTVSDGSGTLYHNPISVSVDTTFYAVDNLEHVSPGITINVEADTEAPSAITLGSTLPSGAVWSSANSKYYTKDWGSREYTLYAVEAGSGIKGFREGSSGDYTLKLTLNTGTKSINASDNVNNVTTAATSITIEADNSYTGFDNITGFDSLASGYYYDSSGTKLWAKSAGSVTVYPLGANDTQSGHAGYSLTSTGAPGTGVAISASGNIFAIDNLGNSGSKYLNFAVDTTGPDIQGSGNEASDHLSYALTGFCVDNESGIATVSPYSCTPAPAYSTSASFDGKTISSLVLLTTLNQTETITITAKNKVGWSTKRVITRTLTTLPSTYTFVIGAQSAAFSRVSVGDFVQDGRRKEKIYTSPVDPASFIGLTGHSATSETAKILQTAFGGDRMKGSTVKPLGANDVSTEAKAAKVQNASVIDLHEAALARARADLERVDLARQNRMQKAAPADDVKVTVDTPDRDSKVVKADDPERILPDMPVRTTQTALESRIATVPASVAEALGTGGSGQQPRPAPGRNLPRDVFMPFCLPGKGRKQEDADGEE